MSRDQIIIYLPSYSYLPLINIYLFGSDKTLRGLDWLWHISSPAGITLSLYSFLYKDNPLFKFAENLYVGVAAAYTLSPRVWVHCALG